ncbi:hypothetical protein [Microbacterium sp. 18062]|uniref:hypothetical protein n=1 Tax=Microbacterium sp. 18062 TaxID=2681410 RepID=UPI001358C32E|nr:hypothetical protein [Microbacterium sp. 18062]
MTDHDTDPDAPAPGGGPAGLIRFRDLPRQPLQEGRGTVRGIWTETDPGLDLRWHLQLVELKGPGGSLLAPAGTHQRIVGLSGPQVAVGAFDHHAVLRRDRAVLLRSSTLSFQRPRLRVTGASMVLVLTFAAVAVPPMFSFQEIDGSADLPTGTRVLLALQGDVRLDGVEVPRQAVALLDGGPDHRAHASSARVLVLSEAVIPGADADPV